MTSGAKYTIGERVVRPIYARGTLNVTVGWRRGVITEVGTTSTWSGYVYFKYTVLWDNEKTPQGAYGESELSPESVLS